MAFLRGGRSSRAGEGASSRCPSGAIARSAATLCRGSSRRGRGRLGRIQLYSTTTGARPAPQREDRAKVAIAPPLPLRRARPEHPPEHDAPELKADFTLCPACRARQAGADSNGASSSGNFTPSGDFSFTSPSGASASFTNPYDSQFKNGNGHRAGDSDDDSDSDSDDDDSDDDDSRPPVKADSDLSDAERVARAAEKKELGNVYYKRADYATAVRHYSHAIDLDPSEPSYHLNRAAARMLLKLFGAALEDCLAAQALQKNDPQSKTLLRTAKCQLALGLVAPAQQSLHEAFRLEPGNRAVATEKSRAERVAQHVSNIRRDLERKEWSMVLLGVDAAARECEADATPREWRIWKVEALVGKKRYDEAASLAACVPLPLSLSPHPPSLSLSPSSPFLNRHTPTSTSPLCSSWASELTHRPPAATSCVSTRSSPSHSTTAACASTCRAATTRRSSTVKKRCATTPTTRELGASRAALSKLVHVPPFSPSTDAFLRLARSTLLKRIRLVEQLKEQGNTAFKEQRTDEAIQKYSEAMDADPDNETIKAVLLSNRAAAYLRVRRLGPSSSMAGSLVGSGAAPLSRRNLC